MLKKVFIPSIPTRWDKATSTRVPTIDVNAASQFGDLILLVDEAAAGADIQSQIERIETGIDDELTDPLGEYYLLCVGDIPLIAAAAHYIQDHHGFISLLRWDRIEQRYNVSEINF